MPSSSSCRRTAPRCCHGSPTIGWCLRWRSSGTSRTTSPVPPSGRWRTSARSGRRRAGPLPGAYRSCQSTSRCPGPSPGVIAAELPDDATLDPIGALAAASGEPDAERWWEDVVEHRGDGAPAFAAIAAAMAAVRGSEQTSPSEMVREAHMRTAIRAALAGSGHRRGGVRSVARAGARPGVDDGDRGPRGACAKRRRPAPTTPKPRSPGCRGPTVACSGAPATPLVSPHRAGTATSSTIPDHRASPASSSTPQWRYAATASPPRRIT